MSTKPDFVAHIVDQVGLGDRLTYRKMFGEYGFHLDGKFVAMACDNSFFIKPTRAVTESGLNLPSRPPYPGAKLYPVADGLLEDPVTLRRLLVETAEQLPTPGPKRAKSQKPGKRR